MLVTDWALGHQALLERVTRALESRKGIAVQHRHPGVTTRQFFDEARELAKVCARFEAPLFINSRLDVALALGAHLHLAAKALSVSDVKPHVREGMLVSHAVHSRDEFQAGADLALVSPVFRPRSKTVATTLGPEGFAALAAHAPCPVFALGGLTPQNAKLLPSAAGFAVMGAEDLGFD